MPVSAILEDRQDKFEEMVDVGVSLFAVIVDCQNPRKQADWWATALLARE